MNQVRDIKNLNEGFRSVCHQFQAMIDQLRSDATAQMEHDQVEILIKKQGTEVMRLLLQGHLNERCNGEQRMESFQGADGTVRTRCRENCERNLMTEFGQVVVRRKGYSAKVLSLTIFDSESPSLDEDVLPHKLVGACEGRREYFSSLVSRRSFQQPHGSCSI